MDNSRFNWCFIGAGRLADKVAKQILPSGRHRISAVYTRNHEKCQEFANQYGSTAYDSAEAAICAPDISGVYVVTPHTSHYEYAKLALSLGKSVLCEKPFTISAPEAEELFAMAREKRIYLAEAMWTWFSPIAQKVKRWYDTGELGELFHAEACFCCDLRDSVRITDPNLGGGALLDLGVYPITYLYRMFGNPVTVQCSGRVEGGIDLYENVAMTFANGLTCTASASMCDTNGLNQAYLDGGKGQIRYSDFHAANQVALMRKAGMEEVFQADGSYLNEFDVAAEEIRQGLTESPLVPPSATIDVMRILDECRQQMGLVYPFEHPA